MPNDDTRDLVIELRAEVRALQNTVTRLMTAVDVLEKKQGKDEARDNLLMWLGAGILAAAGGTGAVVAKWLGWVASVAK